VPLDPIDRIEIHDLVARYNLAIDTGDVEGWVATFTPDGVFDGIVGQFAGAAALRRFASAYASDPAYERYRVAQHWVNNLVVDGQGDRARLRCQHLLVAPTATGGEVILVAAYDDELVRTPEGWRFALRRVRAAGGAECPGIDRGPGSTGVDRPGV
jgi:hypothetical protein